MAVALSQHGVKQQTFSSSFSITVTSVAANDIAVLAIRFFSNPGTTTISGLGATWTKRQSSDDGSTYCELWTGVGATSGTSISISTTNNTYSDTGWQVWSGGALIVSTNITGVIASTATHRTSAAATTAANQGVAAFLISDNDHVSSNTYTFSDTPGSYTTQDTSYDASTAITVHSASRISGATDFEQRTGTLTTGAKYCGYSVVIGASGDSTYTVPTSGYVTSTGASAGSGASIASSVPLATRTGNLMCAGVTIAQAGHKVTQPAGWTSMGSVAASGGGELFLFYRMVATNAEAGTTLTWTLDATDANAKSVALAVYAGVNGPPILMDSASLTSGTVLNFSTSALKSGQSFLRIAGAYNSGSTTSLAWTSGSALTVTKREEDTGTGGTSSASLTSIADWTATSSPLSDSGNHVTAGATTSLVGATLLFQSAIATRDAQIQHYENVGLGVVAKQDAWAQAYQNSGLGAVVLRDGWTQAYENVGLAVNPPSKDDYAQVYANAQYLPNDDFVNARQLVVPSGSGIVSGSDGQVTPTYGYTVEAGEPDQSGVATTSAWWYLIAGAGTVTIQGNNTNRGLLAVYIGSTLTGLSVVTWSSYWYNQSISFTAIAGQQYYIQAVDGDTWNLTYTAHGAPVLDAATFSPTRAGRSLATAATVLTTIDATAALTRTRSSSPTATLDTYRVATLSVTRNRTLSSSAVEYARPSNDNFANAITLAPTGGSLAYANVLATREDGEPDSDTNTIWYVWTAPDAGSFSVTSDISSHAIGLFSGTTVAGLVQLDLPYFVDLGEVYYVSVYSDDAHAASGNLTWTFDSVTRGPGGAGDVDGTTGDLVLTALDDIANVETPGALMVNLSNAAPSTNVDFYVDGVLAVSADSDDAGTIVSVGLPLDSLSLGAHTVEAFNLTYNSNTVSFTVTTGDTGPADPADDDPPTPIPPTPATVQRWTLEDPATGEFYTFTGNPLQMTTPFAERTFNLHATTGIQGQYLTFEGAPVAAPWRFSGKLVDQAQYDALKHWCAKKARIFLTDHYMRQWEVVLFHFNAKPNIKNYSHKWLTDYEVEAFITRGPL